MELPVLDDLGARLSPDVIAAFDEIVATRRDLHAHPELKNEERRTQRVVLERLRALGIPAEPRAGTGVVGLVEGAEIGRAHV